jgi:hypothetical protein
VYRGARKGFSKSRRKFIELKPASKYMENAA